MNSIVLLAAFIGYAVAENSLWAQCGGQSFAGTSTCVSGSSCVYVNNWYSQCQPGVGPTTATSSIRTVTTISTTSSGTSKASSSVNFKWFGVDESGAEFGTGIFPGTWGKDFIFPSESSISGFNIFRIPFSMERLVPNTLTSAVSTPYLRNLTATVDFITGKGGYAIIDPHNFGRYYGSIITDVSGFQAFWTTVASNFKSNTHAVFDTNNEYHDMDQSLVLKLNQAAIDGIRAAGATSQYIMVEGNSYSGAWTWNVTNDNLKALTDPQGKIVYEMHQYLDSDGSGTSATCVSADIGQQRIAGATTWLRQNGKIGFLGEFAGGANSVCQQAVTGMLNHMKANSDVWAGACWWGGGPWWGDYIYSFEPPSGTAYSDYDSLLKNYAP